MTSNFENDAQIKEDIVIGLQNEELALNNFIETIKNKDVIIFMGNTRSGKTTLAKFLSRFSLEAIKSNVRMEFKIQETDCDEHTIGHGSLSNTTLPKTYSVPNSNSIFIDLPGFEDNRGLVQEIANALGINQIKLAATVKFVLVFDINEITSDCIRNFTNCLQQVHALIRNYKDVQNAFCAIFTKDWRDYSQNEISNLLYEKIVNISNLDFDKQLVQIFVDDPNRIGIFKMPSKVGEISQELNFNITEAIAVCQQINISNCDVKFPLSDKVQEALLQIYPKFMNTNYFEPEIQKSINKFDNYFRIDKYVYASYDEELSTTKNELQNILFSVAREKNEQRTYLINIKSSLIELVGELLSREFINDFQFMCVLNNASLLEDQYTNSILENYKNSLDRLMDKINKLINKIKAEQKERSNENYSYSAIKMVGVAGSVPAALGLGKIADPMVGNKNLKQITETCTKAYDACENVLGETATKLIGVVGVVTATAAVSTSYTLYLQTTKKRNAYRQAQFRTIS